MDISMDIDSDDFLPESPLNTFLARKLSSLQEANQQLCTAIEVAKCSIVNAEADSGGKNSLIVRSMRKRYHNGKWCFILDVSSLDSTITYQDFHISLKWSPTIAPQYTLMICSNDLRKIVTNVTKIYTNIFLIIAFESMQFVSHKSYEAEAAFFYTAISKREDESPPSKCHLKLGTLSMGAEEMNCGVHEIKNIHLINGETDDVLAALACSAQIKLAMTLPTGDLKDCLVIDCMFREVGVDGNKWYLLNANSAHLNGCILEYVNEDGVNLATLYFRDQFHLHSVIHHLHSHIKGIKILPLIYKSQLHKQKRMNANANDEEIIFASQVFLKSQQPKPVNRDAKKFGECLLRQIDSVIDFHRNVVGNKEIPPESDVTGAYHAMRNSLTLQESTSDSLLEKLLIE